MEGHLKSETDRILILEGARQVGKSFIIRKVGERLYKNFIEINFVKDDEGPQLFKEIRTTEEFYFILSSIHGKNLDSYKNTLVFLDEIQHYPQYLTLLKFFREDHRFRFIASGCLLGLTLRETTSIPVGSIIRKSMYQLDFEEFLLANNFGFDTLETLRQKMEKGESIDVAMHNYIIAQELRLADVCQTIALLHHRQHLLAFSSSLSMGWKSTVGADDDEISSGRPSISNPLFL